MNKIYRYLLVLVILSVFNSSAFSQSSYITLGDLGTTSFCANGNLSIPFTTNMVAGTVFNAFLSDSLGSFNTQTAIGSGTSSPLYTYLPFSIPSGTNYKIKIQSSNLSVVSDLSQNLSTNGQRFKFQVRNLENTEINFGYSICAGSALTAIISSNQIGTTYEWYKDGVFQQNNVSLRITQSGNYASIAYKNGCSYLSNTINMNFGQNIQQNMYVDGEEYQCNGVSVVLLNSYYSDSATYQWKKNDNIIIGESKSRLVANTSGLYSVVVKDKCFNLESPKSNLSFNNSIPNRISSSVNGVDSRLICGSIKGSLSASSSYNRNTTIFPYTYQWKKNGVNIPNQTGSRLENIQDGGSYSLTLTQGNCISNSEVISFTKVDTIKLKLSIPSYHANEICSGLNVDLNVGNIIPLQGVQISYFNDGIRFYSYTYNDGLSTWVSQAGKYTVIGTATGCVILPSDTVKIIVSNKLKPIIYSEGNILCGSSSLSMEAASGQYSALPNINHKWYRNNQVILNENSAFSSLMNVTQGGFYKLKVTSGSCTGFSDSIQVKTVVQIPKPQIIRSNESSDLIFKPLSICNNTLIKLSAISDYYNPDKVVFDSLLWKRNGVIISKQNRYGSIPTIQSGIYTVVGKQGTCETESDPIEIKIGEPITANITGSTSIYPGQKAKLNLNFTGGNAWSFQTSDMATGQTTSLSPTLKNVSPNITQTYAITSVASNCGIGTVTGNATITVLPCPIGQTISVDSGNWNASTTWTCGQIPTSTLDAIIEQGHIVNLPNGYQGETKKLDLRGGITQGVGASVKVSN